jgi:long-chain fatty acid transport protein
MVAVSLGVVLLSAQAMAGGISLLEHSTKGLGVSFAGGIAADEASTIFYNPAGLTRLQKPEAQAAGHVIFITADFDDKGSSFNLPAVFGGGDMTGKKHTDAGETVFVPSFFASIPFTDRFVGGIGVHAPYGLATEYDDNWTGRYHAIKSELITVNVNPSFGLKLTHWLSVGAGLSFQYADAELTNAVDLGTIGALGGVPGAAPGNTDGKAKVTGDDWGYGWNAGVMISPTSRTRFGVHYRSEIDHTLEGNYKLNANDLGNAIAGGVGLQDKQDVEATVELPETLSFQGYHEFNDQWAIMADVTWTNYSRLNELVIELESGVDSTTTFGWDDTWRYALGVNYKPIPNLVIRAGGAYDESPVPNKRERTPRVPDDDRIWGSIGVGYTWFDRLTVDFSYAHLFIGDNVKIDKTADVGDAENENFLRGNLVGEYEASADIVGLQVRYVF